MVYPLPLIFKVSSPCTNLPVTVSRAPITIAFTVTYIFHSFSNPLICPGTYLNFHFLSNYAAVSRESKVHNSAKSKMSLYVSFSRTDSGSCTNHLFPWSNFSFLHSSQCITLPTQSCLVLYCFCANFLNSLIIIIYSSIAFHISVSSWSFTRD